MADYEWLHEIIERQAGSYACGSLLGDATGIAIIRYAEWEDAKRGIISRREFVKLHIVTDVKGRKIVSCAITRGRAHDSPVFREMIKKVPDGTGCVMLDAGYDAHENYKMIHNTGRRPVICTRKNHVVKGFSPRAEMLRWQEKNPEEFEDTYHQRSIVESVFSSFKCRFTAVVWAKTLPTQRLQLLPGVSATTCCHRRMMQEIHVTCLACAMHLCAVLARDAPHHLLSRENSVRWTKSKPIKYVMRMSDGL